MILKEVELIWKPEVQDFCKMPYPGYPRGCPMYDTRASCPPEAPLIDDVLDLTKPIYAAAIEFDLKGFEERMRRLHPDWSEKQLRNPRYWQGTARRKLKDKIELAKHSNPNLNNLLVLYRPEANGVHVVSTMRKVGVKITFPPKETVILVAIIGHRKAGKLREVFG